MTAEQVYAILKKKIDTGGATDQKIINAITTFLEQHPEYIGATTEQAQEIQQNTDSIKEIQKNYVQKEEGKSLFSGNYDDLKNLPDFQEQITQYFTSNNLINIMAVDSLPIKPEADTAYLLKEDNNLYFYNEKWYCYPNYNEINFRIEDLKSYIGYSDKEILGLQVDFKNNIFRRLAGAFGKNAGSDFSQFPMYGGRRRCIVNNKGEILHYYGDDGYEEKQEDNKGQYQVMVYQPKFYYKVVPVELEKNEEGLGYHLIKVNYYISSSAKDGFRLHPAFYNEQGDPVEYILYSAYEGSLFVNTTQKYFDDIDENIDENADKDIDENIDKDNDTLCSVPEVKPISGQRKRITEGDFEKIANNLGTGWHINNIKSISAQQLLMIIEFGCMNMQKVIGEGVTIISEKTNYNNSSLTGSTSNLGNTSGSASSTTNTTKGSSVVYTESGKVSISYRGVENPYGNIQENILGINIQKDDVNIGGQPYICDNFNFSLETNSDNYKPVGFTVSNTDGYISSFGYKDEGYDWLFMPSKTNGTSELPVGDSLAISQDNTDNSQKIRYGGYWNTNTDSGIFRYFLTKTGTRGSTLGARLLYVPQSSLKEVK